MRLKKLILALLILILPAGNVLAELEINEVMANEPGGNVMLEWIELYNNTDNDFPLAFYSLKIDNSVILLPTTRIFPYEYMVLCRKLISDSVSAGFEEIWGNGSGYWGDDSTIESYRAIELSGIGLTNSGGSVELELALQTVSTLIWESDGGDGVSWERRLPNDTTGLQCLDPSGSTPGRLNSVTPLPYDLALESVVVEFYGSGICRIGVLMVNFGLEDMPEGELSVYYDPDNDGVPDSVDLIAIVNYPQTNPDDTIEFDLYFELDGVNPSILIQLPPDNRMENNLRAVTAFGVNYPPVILNEFLADPQSDVGTEWLELRNRSNQEVSLSKWYIGDEIKFYPIMSSDPLQSLNIVVDAHDYLVLCKDKAAFENFYGTSVNVVEMNSWPALNNDGDIIKLRDNFDYIVDSIRYDFTYGGNYTWARGEETGMTDRWGRSVDVGGTPGRENKVYYQPISSRISVSAEPNPFSPSKDGEMTIAFEVPQGENMTIRIYDTKGRIVRTLVDGLPAFEGRIVWDGRSDGGRLLPIGMYILFLEVADVDQYKQTVVIAP
ncbi:MAG: lamin tail domain-containing protein [Candidatus Zixiibacteriota bacterium]